MRKRHDPIASVTIVASPLHTDNNLPLLKWTVMVRREDVTTTIGAFRAIREELHELVDDLLDNLREFTPEADA